MVLPWHPRLARGAVEDGVRFHPFRYAPHPQPERVRLRRRAARGRQPAARRRTPSAPLALAASAGAQARRVAREVGATLLHGHWVIPGGAIAAAAGPRLPMVVSLHGSDVYVAERHAIARRAARGARFARADWMTACSDDLRDRAIALGADAGAHRDDSLRRGRRSLPARTRTRAPTAARALGVGRRRLAAVHRRAASSARRASST